MRGTTLLACFSTGFGPLPFICGASLEGFHHIMPIAYVYLQSPNLSMKLVAGCSLRNVRISEQVDTCVARPSKEEMTDVKAFTHHFKP